MKMEIHLLLMALFLPGIYSERKGYDYCKIQSCPAQSHVFCQYKKSNPAYQCGDVSRSYLSNFEKQIIVNMHNHFRWLVYTGQESRGKNGGQPGGITPTYLEWNEELEDIAHRWSVQCVIDYADCSNVDEFSVYQLISNAATENQSEEFSIESILWEWYNEVINFDNRYVHSYSEAASIESQTFHYTQMVWKNTRKIGCNVVRHSYYGYKRIWLVCNYGPRGNNEGEPIYY